MRYEHTIKGVIKEVDGRAPVPSAGNLGPFLENVVVETDTGDWTLSATDLPVEFDELKKNIGKKITISWEVEIKEK